MLQQIIIRVFKVVFLFFQNFKVVAVKLVILVAYERWSRTREVRNVMILLGNFCYCKKLVAE